MTSSVCVSHHMLVILLCKYCLYGSIILNIVSGGGGLGSMMLTEFAARLEKVEKVVQHMMSGQEGRVRSLSAGNPNASHAPLAPSIIIHQRLSILQAVYIEHSAGY